MKMKRRQRGITTVEFAIIGALLMISVFGVIEFGRLLWAWNTLGEATRRGARAAAVCPVGHGAPANIAVFNAPGGSGGSPILAGLSPANVTVQYLDDSGAVTATFEDIQYVRVGIVNYTHQMFIPFLSLDLTAPAFSTTLPRESLGIVPDPGAPPPQCFGF